jgi:hypothetical protein
MPGVVINVKPVVGLRLLLKRVDYRIYGKCHRASVAKAIADTLCTIVGHGFHHLGDAIEIGEDSVGVEIHMATIFTKNVADIPITIDYSVQQSEPRPGRDIEPPQRFAKLGIGQRINYAVRQILADASLILTVDTFFAPAVDGLFVTD